MRNRITGEQLLISALLNNGDARGAVRHGVTVDHFRGFDDEYKWLLNYYDTYQTQPTRDVFLAAFPDFRMCDHDDIRSAVDALFTTFYGRRLTEAIDMAFSAMARGDVDAAWRMLERAKPKRTSAVPKSLVKDMTFFDHYNDEPAQGIEVPQRTLQRLTGGIRPGQLWYLGGRTGNGKSAHLCNIAAHAMVEGRRIIFYSCEMTEHELRCRVHAILANLYGYPDITSLGIRNHTVEYDAYKTFVGELGDLVEGEIIVHTPAEGMITAGAVCSKADEYDLVIVDHIGLVRPDGNGYSTDDWRVAARISNSFKELALSTNTPVLASAQVNREGDHPSRVPSVKHLADTDALGRDADVVVMLKSLEYDVATKFHLPKNRDGYAKRTWFSRFDVNNGRFDEISGDQAEDLVLEADTNE